MLDQKNARLLILKWGDSTIVITRIPEVLPQVTDDDPVVLFNADLDRIDAVCKQKGRTIACNPKTFCYTNSVQHEKVNSVTPPYFVEDGD